MNKMGALTLLFIIFLGYSVSDASIDVDKRVVNGKPVKKMAEAPFMASLMNSYTNAHACGGTLINNQWILTAAHCFKPYPEEQKTEKAGKEKKKKRKRWDPKDVDNWQVSLGSITRIPFGEGLAVRKIVWHPDYKPEDETKKNDIALVKLTKPVKFTKKIKAVELIQPKDKPLATCRIYGWGCVTEDSEKGGSDSLHIGMLSTLDEATCKKEDKSYRHDIELCAKTPKGKAQAGHMGDSGGPLICLLNDGKAEDTLKQVGVFSNSGSDTIILTSPQYFVRVSAFEKWIKEEVERKDDDK